MEDQDIRWKQRFSNFQKALAQLENALSVEGLSQLEKAGVIQIFEFTFELGWKTIRDFLEENKVEAKFPKDVIKEGFKYELINDGDVWMDMLEKRNLMSHTYDEARAELAFDLISKSYFKAIRQVYETLRHRL